MGNLTMEFYLKRLKSRYLKASRKAKTKLLDEFCETTGLGRKHAIHKLNRTLIGFRDKPAGRKKEYLAQDLLKPLKEIWLATDQMCSERLKVAILFWLPFYELERGNLSPEVKQKLLSMSKSTIDRLIKPLRVRHPKRMCGTKPGTLLKKNIPIKTNQWDEKLPGFVEADTVAHCGTSLLGNFVWSITLTDIFSGWTENAAVWNKGAHGVLSQIRLIEARLPFNILGFDCDNGSEFLNHHLLKYLKGRPKPAQFTRSRPYHKGDNAHVEQKNWTHVRQLFGYERFEDPNMVGLMNDLYRNELSLLHNYFYPAMKLKDKSRIGSKTIKKYDSPKTPFQRLMESEHVSMSNKEQMCKVMKDLNPFELTRKINLKLKNIFSYIDLKLNKRAS